MHKGCSICCSPFLFIDQRSPFGELYVNIFVVHDSETGAISGIGGVVLMLF